MRKIYLTESQLHNIIESVCGGYLDTDINFSDAPESSIPLASNEVSVENPTSNSYKTDTDKVQKQRTPSIYGFRLASTTRSIYEQQLNEENSDLANKSINLTNQQIQQLKGILANNQNNKNANGYDRAQNWTESGKISYADAYRTLRDYQNKDYSENSIIPKEFINFLNGKINNGKAISQISRNTKSTSSKMSSSIMKKPRQSNNGQGHHSNGEKMNNGGTLYYK